MSLFSSSTSGKTTTLADFTDEALIIPDLKARDIKGVIWELSHVFPLSDARWDALKLNEATLGREQQMSTAMEFGAAFPHARSAACLELRFALGRLSKPIEWGPPGSLAVQFIFLNAVPINDALGYLKLISGMARFGKEPALFEQLKAATTARDLLNLLGKMPVRK